MFPEPKASAEIIFICRSRDIIEEPWWIRIITVWLFIVLVLLCCCSGSLESHHGIFNLGQTKHQCVSAELQTFEGFFFSFFHWNITSCGVTVHNDLWCDRLSDCHKSLKTNFIANSRKSTTWYTVKRCNLWDQTRLVWMFTSWDTCSNFNPSCAEFCFRWMQQWKLDRADPHHRNCNCYHLTLLCFLSFLSPQDTHRQQRRLLLLHLLLPPPPDYSHWPGNTHGHMVPPERGSSTATGEGWCRHLFLLRWRMSSTRGLPSYPWWSLWTHRYWLFSHFLSCSLVPGWAGCLLGLKPPLTAFEEHTEVSSNKHTPSLTHTHTCTYAASFTFGLLWNIYLSPRNVRR